MPRLLPLFLLLSACPKAAPAPRAAEAAPAAGCDAPVLDLLKGTLGGVSPTASQDEVNQTFPCATGSDPDGVSYNVGGGVYFLEHDFFFYTGRDFIEVRKGFVGSTAPLALGAPVGEVTAALGRDPSTLPQWPSVRWFTADYGCLRLDLDEGGTVVSVGAHAQACAEVAAWYGDFR